jgi:hypothetical protein
MLRILVVYRPFRFFAAIAAVLLAAGTSLGLRFVYHFMTGDGSGHVQSVVLAATLIVIGFLTGLLAFLADLLSVNRRLLEELTEDQRARRATQPIQMLRANGRAPVRSERRNDPGPLLRAEPG